MERIRPILYEAAIIILSGVGIALIVLALWRNLHPLTIEGFAREYSVANSIDREVIAERYLKSFTPEELLHSVSLQSENGVCHLQAHPMGRVLYRHSQNFSDAIRTCGGSCEYGCFHGAMMEMFQTDSDTLGGAVDEETPEGYLNRVKAVAKDLCTRPEVMGVVRQRFCTHGIGHTFAVLADRDLDAALRSCEVMKTVHDKSSCVSGAMMEYVFDPRSASSTDAKGDAPCDRYPAHISTCYRYKAYGWLKVWGTPEAALKGCAAFGKNEMTCIFSIGQAASSPKLVHTKAGMDSICGSITGERHIACVAGALLKVVDLNDGDDDHACVGVAPEYAAGCAKVLRDYHASILKRSSE